ncbi:hypothetical protein LTR36_008556 [Oleoguttula mirabilis]|uniref:Uncharacterized protein n=1 Tax=Oleoguttula mirabilis TaxID=1507867 RepID=A0AAV9JTC1_9PEZI|nr:hypothetical protein LTR36_008556 [Oleoguttula mirabilis]
MLLWGFLPTSSLPVDLKLVPADAKGHRREDSNHRSALMTAYNRYVVRDSNMRLANLRQADLDSMAWEAVYLDKNKGDLSKAVVVNFSASGKTARAFTDSLINEREPDTGPLGMLAITGMADGKLVPRAPFPMTTTSYNAISDSDTLSWLADLRPAKVVICDFGGRGHSLLQLYQAVRQQLETAVIVTVGIGSEPKPWTGAERVELRWKLASVSGRYQMNTSALRDVLVERKGAEAFWKEVSQAWDRFVERGNLEEVKLVWSEGIEGDNGIEDGWEKLCRGEVPSDAAYVYRV